MIMTKTTILVCCILAAVNGGVFFAFSNFVMRALDRRGPDAAAESMRSINVAVITPSFMALLFGTGLVSIVAAVLVVQGGDQTWLVLAGAFTYIVGCLAVTIFGNVPLNQALGGPTPIDWSEFYRPWMRYNHIRTAACFLSAALFGGAALGVG